MQKVKAMFVKGGFFFVVGVIFATLFIWSLVEGILSHVAGGNTPLMYYYAAWLAGVGALTLYFQARRLIHYASISE